MDKIKERPELRLKLEIKFNLDKGSSSSTNITLAMSATFHPYKKSIVQFPTL